MGEERDLMVPRSGSCGHRKQRSTIDVSGRLLKRSVAIDRSSYACDNNSQVLPCLCESKRRTSPARDSTSHFLEGSSWVPGKVELGAEMRGGESMSFPHPEDNMEKPFFFGVDIRSESEMRLGRFPKVSATPLCVLTCA